MPPPFDIGEFWVTRGEGSTLPPESLRRWIFFEGDLSLSSCVTGHFSGDFIITDLNYLSPTISSIFFVYPTLVWSNTSSNLNFRMPSATDLLSAADRVFWLYLLPVLWFSSLAFGLTAVALKSSAPTAAAPVFVLKIYMSAWAAREFSFADWSPLLIFSRNLTYGTPWSLRGGPSHVPIVSLLPSSFSDVSRIFSRVGLERTISSAIEEFVRMGRRS